MKIILSSNNKNKIKEFNSILKLNTNDIIPLSLLKLSIKIRENGKTLKENAIKKASKIAIYTRKWTISDDSGLEVDYLNGAPGIYSARFAGNECSYIKNNKKLLCLLKNVPKQKRTAKFKTVIAISNPYGKIKLLSVGYIFGIITESIVGHNGFGYDSVFYIPTYNKTLAELDFKLKNSISHRAIALKKAKKFIVSLLKLNREVA
ncbi:MAG: RdgB/HAM1 family non-canonical purine NTP pyrophosphatase [Endomicrobium sp.]|nr:RdgB/HAM1 family non-canonical purine NTP pyrophosphatase [Endomicrobium sp.]